MYRCLLGIFVVLFPIQLIAQGPSNYVIFSIYGGTDMYPRSVVFYSDSSFNERDSSWQIEFKDKKIYKEDPEGIFFRFSYDIFNELIDSLQLSRSDTENKKSSFGSGTSTSIFLKDNRTYWNIIYSTENLKIYYNKILSILNRNQLEKEKVLLVSKALKQIY